MGDLLTNYGLAQSPFICFPTFSEPKDHDARPLEAVPFRQGLQCQLRGRFQGEPQVVEAFKTDK